MSSNQANGDVWGDTSLALSSSPFSRWRWLIELVACAAILICLLAARARNLLLFHVLVEFAGVSVTFALFMLYWNVRRYLEQGALLVLGIGYAFVGTLDLLHALSFPGMNVFLDVVADLPCQLWISARAMESATLLSIPFLGKRRVRGVVVFWSYAAALILLLVLIFHWRVFPACSAEDLGLTVFKVVAEYVICAALACAALLLWTRRHHYDRTLLLLLLVSIGLTVISEFCFTLFPSESDYPNTLGYLLKLVSFYLVYKALVETGLKRPYDAIFSDLHKSEERHRVLFESMMNGCAIVEVVYDAAKELVDFRIVAVNPAFEKITGMRSGDITGKLATEIFRHREAELRRAIWSVAQTGKPIHFEDYAINIDRHLAYNIFQTNINHLVIVFADITERVLAHREHLAAERSLMEARKAESLVVMAGGIAHDFNNLLMAVLGNEELALGSLPEGAPARRYIATSHAAAKRAADLTRKILDYSGRGHQHKAMVDVGVFLSDLCPVLESAMGGSARLEMHTAPDLPAIHADVDQLGQALTNLVLNASEALPEDGGTITVAAWAMHTDATRLAESILTEKPAPGRYVCFEVRDTGHGIPEAIQHRVFDPFFTTKFVGRGLGLPAVMGVVRGHDGALFMSSVEGKGSVFQILFPAMPEANIKQESDQVYVDVPSSGKLLGNVLVIEPDDALRVHTVRLLERQGMIITATQDYREAVELYRAQAGQLALVVLADDASNQSATVGLLKAMHSIRPEIPVLVTTSLPVEEARRVFTDSNIAGLVKKPYSHHELRGAVEKILMGT